MATYLKLAERGELRARVEQAKARLTSCTLCPRMCRVNRWAGEEGKCRVGRRAWVSSCGPHFGEEAPLVGRGGSGTIFFTFCNLRCLFCQNCSISQQGEGREVSSAQLAAMMLSLQEQGCHNLNLVTPTHVTPQILEALELAIPAGLRLPLVYNCGGYESVATLRLLDGIVDIYMPDMKYADEETARRFSGMGHYPQVNRAAVKEMHRQVGDLTLDAEGVAQRGLLVRHLVLPHSLGGSAEVFRFLAQEISPNTYLNVMGQYRPAYRAAEVSALARPITREEFQRALEAARRAGLHRLDQGAERSLLARLFSD
ncbi:MAG: radical SAM protein [Chloroflexi bacterium]|nr:radical SAM protein [Chloroflexota bacterium]